MTVQWTGKQYLLFAKSGNGASGGINLIPEEYDETHNYAAGAMVYVNTPRIGVVVAGITLRGGAFVVPAAGTDKAGRMWAGSVPANPTTANNYAVPQALPTSYGAAPNDKFYWMPINLYCNSMA